MGRVVTLRTEAVEYMPDKSDMLPGVLYHSERFHLAIHICACGECGQQTVTPLGPGGWELTALDSGPSLTPSIGNFQMPCRSHYFVRSGKIVWC
jgi:hypothetical protein